MTLDQPAPFRPLPADFAGPICAACKHARPQGKNPGPRDYACIGYEPKVLMPAQRNPITGEMHEEMLRYAYGHEKNDQGQCDRFEAKPIITMPVIALVPVSRPGKIGRGNGTTVEVRVGWVRRLAARLGVWLVGWSEECTR